MAGEVWFGTAFCVTGIILFMIAMGVIVVLVSRKLPAGYVGPAEINQFLFHFDMLMRARGWQTTVHQGQGKINVTKDSVVAADFYFQPLPDGRIWVHHGASAGTVGWVLMILLLLTTIFGAVVVAVVLHYSSRKFAQDEVIPMIIRPEPQVIEVRPLR
jgi:hypothetical protein